MELRPSIGVEWSGKTVFASTLPPTRDLALPMIPLVDLFFILLVFFVMGTSVVFQPGIRLDLPESDEPQAVADKLVVSLTREGLIFFNEQRAEDLNDLENKLLEAVSKRARSPIIIVRADRASTYEELVRLLSVTRRHGARVFLVTKSSKGGR